MSTATSIPTIPYDRVRPELPKLDMSQIPPELPTLGEPFKSLVPERNKALRAATSSRGHYQSLGKTTIDEARKADSDALLEAAKAGKPDPGREHEMKAMAEIEAEYSRAETLTRLANEATAAIRAAMVEAEGKKPLAAIEAQLEAAGKMKDEGAEQVLEAVARIEALRRLRETVRRTVEGKGFQMLAQGSLSPLNIAVNGMGIPASLAAEQLLTLDPKLES